MNERKSIGAWKKQTSKGEVINFTIDGKKYAMWPNLRKEKPGHPDFNIIEDTFKPKQTAFDKLPADKEYIKNTAYINRQGKDQD